MSLSETSLVCSAFLSATSAFEPGEAATVCTKPKSVPEADPLAIARVRTTHFAYTDIDLWPDQTLHGRLTTLAQQHADVFGDARQAFVVPAFMFMPGPWSGGEKTSGKIGHQR